MSKVKMSYVVSVIVAVFFLSTAFVFAEDWQYDPTNNLIFTTSAKVGIGTSTPNKKLVLSGYCPIKFDTDNGKIILGPASGWGTFSSFGTDNGGFGLWHNQNGVYQYWIGGSVSDAALSIDSTGNVGIGTPLQPLQTLPYKLAVEGSIGAREVIVTQAEWSDFVFKNDYNLRPLDKVESYIKENNHLPDIPSENEIKEKGLSMADMMAKQMQKIEELTLYLIENQKTINELKSENEKLSHRVASLEQNK